MDLTLIESLSLHLGYICYIYRREDFTSGLPGIRISTDMMIAIRAWPDVYIFRR